MAGIRRASTVLVALASVVAPIATSAGAGDPSAAAVTCPGGPWPLAAGTPVVASLPNVSGASCEFSYLPVAGRTHARIDLTDVQGDFDLYVKLGSRATIDWWSCRSRTPDLASESCSIYADEWMSILVRRASGSGSFTLKVTALDLPTCSAPGVSALANATPASASTMGSWGDRCYFSFEPVPGLDLVDVWASGAVALFVREGALPTRSVFDCAREVGSSLGPCTRRAGGPLYAMAVGHSSPTTFTLGAQGAWDCTLGPGPIPLEPGVPVTAASPRAMGGCLFALEASPSSDIATFSISSARPQVLRARSGVAPTPDAYDCWPVITTYARNACKVAASGETAYAKVWPGFDGTPFTIEATEAAVPTLVPGVPALGASSGLDESIYKLHVPDGAAFASVTLASNTTPTACPPQACPNAPRVGVSVSAGILPTLRRADCDASWGPAATCAFQTEIDAAPGELREPTRGVYSPVTERPLVASGKYFVTVFGLAPSQKQVEWALVAATG